MKLTDFKTKSAWTIGILAIISLWIAFPLIFKYWVFKLLVTPPFTTEAFASLGPIGDIFGGLTAFFTSLTLIIVLYSAYLQREANKDAREAMADQLQQARQATTTQSEEARQAVDDQLAQARESTQQQLVQAKDATAQQLAHAKELSDLQLAHAKEVATQQLELVQKTHDAQIKESRYSVFSNMFYAFLNQKNEILRRLCLGKNYEINPNHLFEHISEAFIYVITEKYNQKNIFESGVEDALYNEFCESIDSFNKESISANMVYSYFYFYITLLELIDRSALEERDKGSFIAIVSTSMSNDEQMCLLWMTSFTGDLRRALANSKFFDADIDNSIMPFFIKNMDLSNFRNERVIQKWKKHLKVKNPA